VKCGPQGSGSAACSKLRAMSLDGLRAWIGEVERKLGMRTRVFLVLVAIAVGGAAAGIYLALEAANESVGKDEVQALQERVGAGTGAAEAGVEAAAVTALKGELEALKAEVETLRGASTPAEPEGGPSEKSREPSEKSRGPDAKSGNESK
jgi:hypothetical protein